ncbi:PPOX class F420-dependent oxidoreductase [Streptomyces sp. NBC_00503]|uniref:PPOX class F420-dependent oxidoreductase n=1 Tax=Streptomyces sp. NBC_00503 TaxID=2903659 RepID=UPI002E814E3C|nr:PPOX class F420-dependent oxidoreductase [Streptomyces sp. NBC_00503]WUD84444.1 PPOX class F420-dependent oxidoreductase [Streptomyces sp. NBC_00503]
MTLTVEDLGRARYVSLTTFRKDGTPVATPVWAAADGGELYVWTRSDSWKVKRIRNNGRVTVCACDVRGRVAPGTEVAEGQARLLDRAGLDRVRKLISRKYTWQYWILDVPAMLARRGKRPHEAIAITLDETAVQL